MTEPIAASLAADPTSATGSPPGLARVRIDLAYDGTAFAGWAKQPGLRTVQGVLEERLGQILRLGTAVSLTVAGRTDAGVHARGQVCHADIPLFMTSNRGEQLDAVAALTRWLPGAVPNDIAVRGIAWALPGFDARFSAVWRRYVYRLCDDAAGYDPLARGHITVVHPTLDVAAMAAAAPALVGLHDFTAFCRARPGTTSIRHLLAVAPVRTGPGRVDVTVMADAFCHSMVRSLVGALSAVGHHQRDAEWLVGLLDRPARVGDIRVLPAAGLTLEEVGYPAPADLARRANEARRRRDEGVSLSADPPIVPTPGGSPPLPTLAGSAADRLGRAAASPASVHIPPPPSTPTPTRT
jgi:tRNA pseudouridine38-40 synthase